MTKNPLERRSGHTPSDIERKERMREAREIKELIFRTLSANKDVLETHREVAIGKRKDTFTLTVPPEFTGSGATPSHRVADYIRQWLFENMDTKLTLEK